jgi:ATP-dependent Clp protease adaptor protein ClpS
MGSSFGRLFRSSTFGGAAVLDKAPERLRKTSPRYKVLLHNDPINMMEDVVTTLQQVVPSLSEQDAIAVMLETHNTGAGLPTELDRHPFVCARALWLGLAAEPAPGRAPGVTGSWPAARPTWTWPGLAAPRRWRCAVGRDRPARRLGGRLVRAAGLVA